jgi:putative tricarboxylic transport membrane protein
MTERTAPKDLAGGLTVLAIAGLYYFCIGDIAESTLSDDVGATGLPRILAYVLAGLGAILVARAIMAGALVPAEAPTIAAPPSDDDEPIAPLTRALGFLAFGLGYVLLVPIIGYLPAIALLIGAIALFEGAAATWKTALIAVGGAVGYWAIFVKVLGVHQPSGWFF